MPKKRSYPPSYPEEEPGPEVRLSSEEPATVSVEARVAEASLGDVKIKYCVFCNKKSTDFAQLGKELAGKWICPDCVLLV